MGSERRAGRRDPAAPKRTAARGTALLLVAVALAACSMAFRAPGVRIVAVRLVALGLTQGTAEMELQVSNPNDRGLDVRGVRYHLRVQDEAAEEERWLTLGEGYHSEPVRLGGHDTTRVTVSVPFRYRAVGAAIRSLVDRGEIPYRLEGEVEVAGPLGPVRVPIRTRGTVGR